MLLAKGALTGGIKLITVGAVDTSKVLQAAKPIVDDIGSGFSDLAADVIDSFTQDQKCVGAFHEALTVLSKNIRERTGGSIVVIIDELDRCRPDFAVKTLERIKHFFDIDGVHFILGANVRQLEASVRCIYGADINATEYLQKFVKLRIHLDNKVVRKLTGDDNVKYLRYLIDRLEIKTSDNDDLLEVVGHIIRQRSLTLRNVEHIVARVALVSGSKTKKAFTPPVIWGLCVLKATDPYLYRKAKVGALTFEEVDKALFITSLAAKIQNKTHLRYWQWMLGTAVDPDISAHFVNDSSRFGLRLPSEVLTYITNNVIDVFD